MSTNPIKCSQFVDTLPPPCSQFLTPEKSCEVFDGISGTNITVGESSIRCPKTLQKIVKPFLLVRIFITIMFLIFGVVIGLTISLAVADLNNPNPSANYATDVSLITFASFSIVILFGLLISSSRVETNIYKTFPQFFK